MNTRLKIDFVSDISCPWCIIGLQSLQQAMDAVAGDVQVDLHFQPFELNPDMPAEGQDLDEHLSQKYGLPPEQLAANREAIRRRGQQLGFTFNMNKRSRIYNTFDAHRLLYWAGIEGKQLALEHALFEAYFTEGQNPGDHEVLRQQAGRVGLDPVKVQEILESDTYAAEVRQRQADYRSLGIHSVPSIIINDRHLIQGGQPPEVFAGALRQIAAGD